MKTLCMLGVIALVTTFTATNVYAQRFTERYIPIGQSPGLSGKHTIVGKIDEVDLQRATLTCTYPSGTIAARVDKNTMIWVDRSKLKLTTLEGSLADCKKGHLVEVKFRNNERRTGAIADWIKVEAAEAGGK